MTRTKNVADSTNNTDNNNVNTLDVVILGAGLSGMITALSLAKIGKKVMLIENKSTSDATFFADPRSTAITDNTRNHFEAIDIWHKIEKITGPIKDIYVVDNKSPEMLHFNSPDQSRYMGYLVLNLDFKKLLLSLVKQNKNITLRDKTAYRNISNNDDECALELLSGEHKNTNTANTTNKNPNKEKIHCDIIIVCDGKHSSAKSRFFSNVINRDYQQKAMTFIVEHELEHEGTAVEHFLPNGPFAILPLKNPHQSSIVWTLNNEKAGAVEHLPEDEFTYMVQKNFGEFLGKITVKEKPKLFPLTAQMASRYVNRRMILLADTAHIIHPLAGQGLNQGIKDIAELSSLIKDNGINNTTLTMYENARKDDNRNMLEITDTINMLFSNNSQIIRAGRKIGFKAIEKITPLKKALIKYAMGHRYNSLD